MQREKVIVDLMDRYGTVLHLSYSYIRNRQIAEDIIDIMSKTGNIETCIGDAPLHLYFTP